MSIDEAIAHAEEVAVEKAEQAWDAQLQEEYTKIKPCKKCATEHRQLAEWLKELKESRMVLDKIRAEMREEMLYHSGTGEEVIQAYADGLKKGLDIIDKYKAESEVSE